MFIHFTQNIRILRNKGFIITGKSKKMEKSPIPL